MHRTLLAFVALLLHPCRSQVENIAGTCFNASFFGRPHCYGCLTTYSLVEEQACNWCINASSTDPGRCMSQGELCHNAPGYKDDGYVEMQLIPLPDLPSKQGGVCLIDHCALANTCGECTNFNSNPNVHCGWCATQQKCMPINRNEPDYPIWGNTCVQSSWALTPAHCVCETRVSCDTCVEPKNATHDTGKLCGWCATDSTCYARGDDRSGNSADGPSGQITCPAFEMEGCCSNATSCGSCLGVGSGVCGWCEFDDGCYASPEKNNCSSPKGFVQERCIAIIPTMAPTDMLGGPVGWTVMSIAGLTIVCCFFPALFFLMLVMVALSKKQRKERMMKMRKKNLVVDSHKSEVGATRLPTFIAGGGHYGERNQIGALVDGDRQHASAVAARRTMRRLSNVGIEMGGISASKVGTGAVKGDGGGGGISAVHEFSNPLNRGRMPSAPIARLTPLSMSAAPGGGAAAKQRRSSMTPADSPEARRRKLNDQLLAVQLEVQSLHAASQSTGQWAWHAEAAKGSHATAHANAHRRRMSM